MHKKHDSSVNLRFAEHKTGDFNARKRFDLPNQGIIRRYLTNRAYIQPKSFNPDHQIRTTDDPLFDRTKYFGFKRAARG